MRRRETHCDAPRTLEEFEADLKLRGRIQRRRTVEEEEEEATFYSQRDYPGAWFFRWLYPPNPPRARRRVERVYWLAWKPFLYGAFLSGFGTMLLLVGLGCMQYAEEPSRGVALVIAALLLCLPGYYSLFTLWMFIRCRKGYTLSMLPED